MCEFTWWLCRLAVQDVCIDNGGVNQMEKHTFSPLHTSMTEGVVADHLVEQIYSSHVAIVLHDALGFGDDFTTTFCKSWPQLNGNHSVIVNGGNHGDSSLVHPFETEEPLFCHTPHLPFWDWWWGLDPFRKALTVVRTVPHAPNPSRRRSTKRSGLL